MRFKLGVEIRCTDSAESEQELSVEGGGAILAIEPSVVYVIGRAHHFGLLSGGPFWLHWFLELHHFGFALGGRFGLVHGFSFHLVHWFTGN